MRDHSELDPAEVLHRLGLTEEMVRAHEMRPDHIVNATLGFDLHRPADGTDDPSNPPPPSGLFYRLNTDQLRRDLHGLLSFCLAGYSMQLRRNGRVVFDDQWRWSKTPVDGEVGWTADVPMHVASVSKLITAMAMTKLLEDHNISPDALIWPWLPPYWVRGPGVNQLTFRHLLTHRSGLIPGPDVAGLSDFQFMKDQIALGAMPGAPGYRNMNFGLCRILLSTMDAPYLFNPLLGGVSDKYWDLTMINYYARYVSNNVFAPVGVTSSFQHTDDNALAYPYPAFDVPGWNSQDLSSMSGCAAWHLSADDLLTVMAAFRRRGLIVDPVIAQKMLDRQFGLDLKEETPLGRIYAKGGFWSLKVGDTDGVFVEQANVFYLPKGMELVVLANSPFCNPNASFLGNVLIAIKANTENILLRLAVTAISVIATFALFRRARARAPKP
jgi:CubicO group peptidase (beta-lactamase class C family)